MKVSQEIKFLVMTLIKINMVVISILTNLILFYIKIVFIILIKLFFMEITCPKVVDKQET